MKLTYFQARGRAELSRLILAQAAECYDDNRIAGEDWPALKPKTPVGQMPVLEVDGAEISQSVSIARFLANKFNLTGCTPLEKAQADMVVDCVADLLNAIYKVHFEGDEAKKKEGCENLKTVIVPGFGKSMTAILTKNGGQYMVGNGLTWADIAIADIVDLMAKKNKDVLTKCPPLLDLTKRVNNLPNIKAWIAKRPVTELGLLTELEL